MVIRSRPKAQGGTPNIGFWDNAADWVCWKVKVDRPGNFTLSVSCATPHADVPFVVEVAGQELVGKSIATGSWADFRSIELGQVELKEPGEQLVKVRCAMRRVGNLSTCVTSSLPRKGNIEGEAIGPIGRRGHIGPISPIRPIASIDRHPAARPHPARWRWSIR